MMTRRRIFAVEVGSALALLILWQLVTTLIVPRLGPISQLFFPSPLTIAETFLREFGSGKFLMVAGPTLYRFAVGFSLSVLLGVSLGLLLGASPLLLRAFDPIIGFFRSLPGVTLIPLLTLWLGLGDASKIALIVSAAIWPILINTVDGVRRIDPTLLETVAAYQISPIDRLWRVLIPAAAPSIAIGMRVAVSVALVVTIISELLGATSGIGGYLVEAQAMFALPELWATLLLLGLIGYALNVLLVQVEARWLAWHTNASRSEG